jgi:TolB-like protein/DNA-binding winged helix-turn-helix (wHTH) protein/Tfp pilus assembly protein PilF
MNVESKSRSESQMIGDLLLDPAQRLLWRGREKIRLPKLSYELLLSLVRHAPGIVSTDQLLTEVWGEVVVGEETVKQRISLLRQALGSSIECPTYIESIRGVGYRLVAPVSVARAKSTSAFHFKTAVLAIMGVLTLGIVAWNFNDWRDSVAPVVAHGPWSVAVLPFQDLSAAADKAYFSDGIHEEIITRLSGVDGLAVTSRTSVLPYRDAQKNLREIARELQVNLIIEGSVRHSGDRVRITVQLIDAENDDHLWAENYDRPLSVTDLFDIQSDVAEQIAKALETELVVDDDAAAQELPTDSLDAYNNYLLGSYHLWRGNAEDLRRSIGFFEAAIAEDDDFLQAHIGLGSALTFAGTSYGWLAPQEAFPQAEKQVAQALRIAPDSGLALSLRGDILSWYRWNWAEAEVAYQKAMSADGDILLSYMLLLSALGRDDEALQLTEKSIKRFPRDQWVRSNAAWRFLGAGEPQRAIEEANIAIEINDTYGDAFAPRGWANLALGNTELALIDLARNAMIQNRSPASLAALAVANVQAGNHQEANNLLDEILALRASRFVPPEEIARIYTQLGDFDAAINWLEQAYTARSRGLMFLNVNASWDPIRSDPRFQEMRQKLGLDVN